MAYTTILMPTNNMSGSTSKTSWKITTFELPVKNKKLRKMALPGVDDDEEEDEQPLIKMTKVLNKDALNIPAEDVQEGEILIATAILNKAMEMPYIFEVLLKHVEAEVVEEVMEKGAKGASVVGTYDMVE